jgi:hypothetical protein
MTWLTHCSLQAFLSELNNEQVDGETSSILPCECSEAIQDIRGKEKPCYIVFQEPTRDLFIRL